MPKLDWQRFIWPAVIVVSIVVLVIAIAESNRNNRKLATTIENQRLMLSSQQAEMVNANDEMAALQEHHKNELKLVSSIVDKLPKCVPVVPAKRSVKGK